MELYDPFADQSDPYETYRRLRDERPVYRNAEHDIWFLSRHEDVTAAARDWERFSSARGILLGMEGRFYAPGDFISTDPPRHDELRAVARPAFIPRAVGAHEEMIRAEVIALLDRLSPGDEVDLAADLAAALPVRIICLLLGIPLSDQGHLYDLAETTLRREPGMVGLSPAAEPAQRALCEYFGALVAAKRREPGDDILSALAASSASAGVLSDAEIEGMCTLLFIAGMETTTGLISNTIDLLGKHRDQRRRLVEDPSRIPDALEESLRYEAPIQHDARWTTADVELHGTTIPAGSWVGLLYGAANRDERRFPDPDVFDTTRQRLRHLAFGNGIHFCLGAPLARLEARIVMEELLARFPEYEIVGEPRRTVYLASRGFAELKASLGS